MSRKVNPVSQRLPIKKNWKSNWYSEKGYGDKLQQDFEIRDLIENQFRLAGIGRVEIKRSRGLIDVTIFTSRPGIVIGHKGSGVEKIKKELNKITDEKVKLNVKEIRKPETWARVMAEQVAYQIERRIAYRRAMSQVLSEITRNPQVRGAKINVAGRLNGSEIARSEYVAEGSLPLQTLRADIDFAQVLAKTKFGSIGVKVWINRGEFDFKDK
jgi:small subunit ribosomal protein S3